MDCTLKTGLLLVVLSLAVHAATFTVSQDGRGQFSSVQAAVNVAGKGDIIKILDNAVYDEQVDIGPNQAGLLLSSENPSSLNKPTIRYQDKTHIHPQSCAEAKDTNTIDFDQNGALRLLRTRNVTIDGIAIDGGGAYPFGASGVWDGDQPCEHPMQHGNGAITVFVSGDITIRNCDISNAYIGVNVKDRNEGGIFANANPADIAPWNVVPLSGFGKTGNHLFERNRIHNNSWGMFFESTWDLGSVIRYNLFYENRHTNAVAQTVKNLTSDGQHQPGGALWFKDHMLSPLAIYNNTFWHNMLIFAGHWQAGIQHLVFNNIYAEPAAYWQEVSGLNTWLKLDDAFTYRMKHCVYAAQHQAPRVQITEIMEYDQGVQGMVKDTVPNYQVRIMDDFGEIEQVDKQYTLQLSSGPVTKTASNLKQEGNRIIGSGGKAFPADANIRWLETTFKSTDPRSPDFLTPDWEDPKVQSFIVDQGWPEAGIRDADGSIADLGAISSGGLPADVAAIKPLAPVVINGTKATARFDLAIQKGGLTNPSITYLRFINNVDFQSGAFGGNLTPLPSSEIRGVPTAGLPVKEGSNSFTVDVPSRTDNERYAFFEIIIEGTGANGQQTVSTVGFLPYRKMEYEFRVTVLDLSGARELDTVTAGDTVKLRVEALKADGTRFQNVIKPVDISLNSGADLKNHHSQTFALDSVLMAVTKPVIFEKVPEGGIEYVSVSGVWKHPGDPDNTLAFYGTSDGVMIKPGPPAQVLFQDPPSNDISAKPPTVTPGLAHDGYLQVYDRFDNRIDQAVQVAVKTHHPQIGGFEGGDQTLTTNLSGRGDFKVGITNGAENDVFTLQANIAANPATGAVADQDVADVKVGKALDKFIIFYGDAGNYDPAATLRGNVGERLPVEIWASNDGGATALSGRTNTFTVTAGASGLRFYAGAAGGQPSTQFTLTAGKATVYVLATSAVVNGSVEIHDQSDQTINSGSRAHIYFELKKSSIASAACFTDNGFGRVDRVELYFEEALSSVPDSVAVYWPRVHSTTDPSVNRITAMTSEMTLDAADPTHVTVRLSQPFVARTTGGSGEAQSYGKPPNLPEAPHDSSGWVSVADSVGPILTGAKVYERFEPGNDTLVVTFSEKVRVASITGPSFTLIKQASGARIPLSVIGIAKNVSGETVISFACPDNGFDSPVAGDLLQIMPAGPVADRHANHAHGDNEPVALTAVSKPVPVAHASYFDTEGDGVVDRVRIRFASPIRDLSDIAVSLTWLDGDIGGQVSSGLGYAGADSAVIEASVTDIFGQLLTDRTGGDMDYIVRYISFDEEATGMTADSAGPVIQSAVYRPGKVFESGGDAPDTLEVVFSEGVRELAADVRQPFAFMSGDPAIGGYRMDMHPLSLSGRTYLFRVDSIHGVSYPSTGDLIWIAAGNVADQNGAPQAIADNKRVAMTVKAKPYNLNIQIGPQPFRPGKAPIGRAIAGQFDGLRISNGVAVVIDPRTALQNGVELDVEAAVYDAVGNMIDKVDGVNGISDNLQAVRHGVSSKLYCFWNGKNRNGRYVGAGTYMIMLKITDNAPGDDSNQIVETKVLGVLPQ